MGTWTNSRDLLLQREELREELRAVEARLEDAEDVIRSIADRHPDAEPGEHPAVDICRSYLNS